MNIQGRIAYWREGSDEDWDSAGRLINSGIEYHWAMFVMHLSIEKALKALIVKRTSREAPKIHNLVRLARLAKSTFTEQQVELLGYVTRYSLHTRYPEENQELRRETTREVAESYRRQLGELRRWILAQI